MLLYNLFKESKNDTSFLFIKMFVEVTGIAWILSSRTYKAAKLAKFVFESQRIHGDFMPSYFFSVMQSPESLFKLLQNFVSVDFKLLVCKMIRAEPSRFICTGVNHPAFTYPF